MYMIFALLDRYHGEETLVFLIFVHPVIALVSAAITVTGCFLIGLPLRVNKKMAHWWKNHWFFQAMIVLTGAVLLGLSVAFPETLRSNPPDLIRHYIEPPVLIPNLYYGVSGWLIAAFGIVHFYPPAFILRYMDGIFTPRVK